MKNTVRMLAASAFAAGLVVLGAGLAGAAPGDQNEPIGPFDALSSCESLGNDKVVNGGWNDYECVGSSGAWLLYRR